ncbi:hypothetical protein AC622_08480 [Bacillus sp. FJAT-27916]|uniref:NUDIX hydrolase n=1 Tax=Bacillus sp. FJAT-27916 TaxID=1679169 RepID=UPI000670E6D7|nr:NUDIX hydrolase [Bacillus sp. FJAT-27916]KMY44282.1 hypothetical protein AC622_08480 [Bacillus sp. FJAT-27916]
MKKWFGSSGVCMNEDGQLLMVLQGKPEEDKTWSIPSGGKEHGETFEECCLREITEETGYLGEIVEEIKVKRKTYEHLHMIAEVHYWRESKANMKNPHTKSFLFCIPKFTYK